MGYIGLTDIPAEDKDDFGLGSYLDSMAQFIETCNTPMTISVQGTWGTGKTSFMKMVSKRLKNSQFIEFNTWKFSQFEMDSSLSVNLIQSLIDDMGLDEKEKTEAKALVRSVSTLVGGGLGVLVEKMTGLGNLGGEAKEIAERVKNALLDNEQTNPVDSVKKIKESFESCVKNA